jgi:hypothetical protein
MRNADCGLSLKEVFFIRLPHSAFRIFSLDLIQLFSVYFRLPKEATENGVNTKTTRDL